MKARLAFVGIELRPHDAVNAVGADENVGGFGAKIAACGRLVRSRAAQGLSTDDLAALKRIMNKIQENLQSSRERWSHE